MAVSPKFVLSCVSITQYKTINYWMKQLFL